MLVGTAASLGHGGRLPAAAAGLRKPGRQIEQKWSLGQRRGESTRFLGAVPRSGGLAEALAAAQNCRDRDGVPSWPPEAGKAAPV